MGFALFSSPFVHPQLQQIVAKMTLLDTLLFYVSFSSLYHTFWVFLIGTLGLKITFWVCDCFLDR